MRKFSERREWEIRDVRAGSVTSSRAPDDYGLRTDSGVNSNLDRSCLKGSGSGTCTFHHSRARFVDHGFPNAFRLENEFNGLADRIRDSHPSRLGSVQQKDTWHDIECSAMFQAPRPWGEVAEFAFWHLPLCRKELKMSGRFRIESQMLEEDLCRPLHLPKISYPQCRGVQRVGGSRARLPSFMASSCSKSSS